jgi:hypothetical protein
MANRFPLIFDNGIKELPTGDNLNLQGSSIVDAINVTASGTIQADTLTATSLSVDGNNIAQVALTGNFNDLVTKPDIFSGSYNDLQDKPVLFSGSYNDLTNRPTIPSKLSQLVNDTGFVTNVSATVPASNVTGLAAVGVSNNFSDLDNIPDYILRSEFTNGSLTIEVKNTGDLQGSVFGTDSTLLVDHINSNIPAEVISGVGNFNLNNSSGTSTFNNLNTTYFSSPRADISLAYIDDIALDTSMIAGDSSLLIDARTKEFYGTVIHTPAILSNVALIISTTSGDLTLAPVDNLNLNGGGYVSITSGVIGAYSDIDITGSTTTISSNGDGGAIYLGSGTHVDIVSAADAQSFQLPSYTNATARDSAIASPVAGMMVFDQGTSKAQVYNGASWVDLH